MSSEQPSGNRLWFHGASILVHGAIAGFTLIAPMPEKPPEAIPITLAEMVVDLPKEEEPPPPEPEPEVEPVPEPEPEPPPPPPEPKPEPEPSPPPPEPTPEPPAQEVAPSEPADAEPAFADLGLVMGGGGPGGVAVAAAAKRNEVPKKPTRVASARKVPPTPTCSEEPTKAKPKKIVPPSYTPEAQQAEIEGPVRLEVVIDEKGHITSVKVLRGLGYGLDEAAITAAKSMVFEPSRRCGKAVASTLTFNMRFTLDT